MATKGGLEDENSETKPLLETTNGEEDAPPEWYTKVPGYGMVQLFTKAKPYALYVLFLMLLAYLLNQLDRYTLPIVYKAVGAALGYGDYSCQANPDITKAILNSSGLNDTVFKVCTTDDNKHNESLCLDQHVELNDDGMEEWNRTCHYWHDGTGILYQVVAGPVFNVLYIVAGVFVGFLADYGHRVAWLSLSVLFWSVATGLTGLVQTYWQLAILRGFLAIGAAGCTPFAVRIMSDFFPQELRGTAMGVYYWGIYFGYSLAFAIGNQINRSLNWRWVFYISGMAGVVVGPIIFLTVWEPKSKKNKEKEEDSPDNDKTAMSASLTDRKSSFLSRMVLIFKTFLPCFSPGLFLLCFAGSIRNAGGYVWAYNTQQFFEDYRGYSSQHIESYMSWIPLAGGSLGAVLGGVISDFLVKGRSPYVRIWVLIVSQVVAAPFAAGALFLKTPLCFLSLIPANVFGEMWIGVTTAVVIDLVPKQIRTTAIAVYLFIITLIGGNFNVLVSPLKTAFDDYKWALFLTDRKSVV